MRERSGDADGRAEQARVAQVRYAIAQAEISEIPRRLPQLAYIAIAPFTGAERAIGLVENLKVQDAVLFRPRNAREGRVRLNHATGPA